MGRNKALIGIDGVPMAARVAGALRDAGCASVVAYGGDPVELGVLGLPVVSDRYPGSGPLGGVLGALELFAGADVSIAGVFVVACDLPALTGPDLVGMIAAARANPDAEVVVARTSGIEPTCAIWNPHAVDPLRGWFEDGERALHVAIGRLSAVVVDLDAATLRNINTPDDLDRYPGPRDS
jgi:molybdopterin-guanine dinucleotide biosynthesis protein A